MDIASMVGTFPKVSETFILNQFSGIIDRGNEIQIFAMRKPDEYIEHEIVTEYDLLDCVEYTGTPKTYAEGLKSLGITIPWMLANGFGFSGILNEIKHGKSSPARLANIKYLHKNSSNYDVCHAHFGTTANRFLTAWKDFNCPLVVSFYGNDASQVPRSNPSIYGELFTEASVVTCLSEDMRSDLVDVGCPPNKTRVVPLCVDPEKFQYHDRTLNPEEPVRIGTVARFVEKKGLKYAIEAVAKLDTDRKIQYSIAGDGERRPELERQIARYDAEDRIELLGWQSQEEVAELMDRSHLFLLPSVTAANGDKEGTPTVLLEAQSAGLPIVSTRHAGIPEIVSDGETGLLVPERNVNALSDALIELISRSDEWGEMGRQGRTYIEENHSIDSITDELIEIYREAV